MSWHKAPKEAEACKDFAERALTRIAELEAENERLIGVIKEVQDLLDYGMQSTATRVPLNSIDATRDDGDDGQRGD